MIMALSHFLATHNSAYLVANIEVTLGFLDSHRSPSPKTIYLDGKAYSFHDAIAAGLVTELNDVDLLLPAEAAGRALWDHRFTNIAV
jgi:hypothetical protein